MNQAISMWLTILIQVLTLVVASLGALWAYVRFVVERGVLPPAQFDIELTVVGVQSEAKIVEILLIVHNLGSSTLVVHDLRVDVRYLEEGNVVRCLGVPPDDARFGQVDFRHSLKAVLLEKGVADRAVGGTHRTGVPPGASREQARGMLVTPQNTFVLAGVRQTYTFVTRIPEEASFALVWASFQYAGRPTSDPPAVRLARRLGLITHGLVHISEPHTAQRAFSVRQDGAPEPPKGTVGPAARPR